MDQKADREVQVFRDFARVAGLDVVLKSIEKRKPPEPDILCCFNNDEWLAFELVEVCVRGNAAFTARAPVVAALIERAYRALPSELRIRFDARFSGKALSFEFNDDTSANLIRVSLPLILSELADQPQKEDAFRFSYPVYRTLISVRLRGRVEDPDRPAFNVAGSFRPDDVVVDTVRSKLAKTYITPHPIELLVYFGHHAFDHDTNGWENPLRETLESQGLGPFRRVWIQGWRGVSLVYPSTL